MVSRDKFFTHAIILMAPQVFHLLFKVLMVNRLPKDYSVLGALIAVLAILATPLSAATTWASYQVSHMRVENRRTALARFIRRALFVFALIGLGAALASLLVGLSFWGTDDSDSLHITIIFSTIVAFIIVVPLINGLLQGMQKYLVLALYVLVFSLGKVAFGLLFTSLGMDVAGSVLAVLCAHAASALLAVIYILTHINSLAPGGAVESPPARMRYLGVSVLALSAVSLLFFADEIIIRLFSSRPNADLFSAAKVIGLIFVYIPVPLISSMFPKVTEAAARGKRTIELLVKCLAASVLLCGVALMVLYMLPQMVRVMTGSGKFAEAADLAMLYSLAVIPVALTNVVVQYELARGRKRFLLALIPCALAYTVAVYFFRDDPFHVARAIGVFGLITAVIMCLVAIYGESRRRAAAAANGR